MAIATEPIEFSTLGKLLIGPEMVLFYFILRCKSLCGFKLIFCTSSPFDTEPLHAMGVATSNKSLWARIESRQK